MRLIIVSLVLLLATNHASMAETYPRKVRIAFLEGCVKMNRQMIKPCKCMLNNFEANIPYKDFVELGKVKQIDTDQRFMTIATHCIQKNR